MKTLRIILILLLAPILISCGSRKVYKEVSSIETNLDSKVNVAELENHSTTLTNLIHTANLRADSIVITPTKTTIYKPIQNAVTVKKDSIRNEQKEITRQEEVKESNTITNSLVDKERKQFNYFWIIIPIVALLFLLYRFRKIYKIH